MYLEVWTAICPHFSLYVKRFSTVYNFFSSHEPSGSHVELTDQADTRRSIARLSSSTNFSSSESKTHGELIGWYSIRRASVSLSNQCFSNQCKILYEASIARGGGPMFI